MSTQQPVNQIDVFLDAERRALEMIVRSAPLEETLAFLTNVVEQQSHGQAVASILFLDDDGRLRTGAAPSLPEAYRAAIDGLKAEPTLGTCSMAAATGRVVVTPDIACDRAWEPLKHLPLALGLKAAWSNPILSRSGRVLGTFGTYFRECRQPTANERRIVEVLSPTAALAIERARAEADLREADRRKNEFIATLSHELRNPLAVLRTGLEMLGAPAVDDAALDRIRGRMVRQVNQLVRLVEDLADVPRIARGELPLTIEQVDAVSIVRLALETSDRIIAAGQHRVTVDLPDQPLWIAGDRMRLIQVVANLLSNAAKYTDAGGLIAVSARRVDSTVEIVVRDNGMGIAADDVQRLFEMFTRGDDERVRSRSGLGIGLALSRQLAALHGGTILAASDGVGHGSTFTLQLPAAVATPVG